MKATRVALACLLCSSFALAEPARALRVEAAEPLADGDHDHKAAPVAFAAEVLVLHATNSQKGIDPRIGAMPELKKPPFSSYDSYELLDRARLPLEPKLPKTLKLPNGTCARDALARGVGQGAGAALRQHQPAGR
ncbi:MAG: hypothetical protein QM756_32005 [Polyangiaceae bacterium]